MALHDLRAWVAGTFGHATLLLGLSVLICCNAVAQPAPAIGFAPATVCESLPLPTGYPYGPPGHWFNPQRVGQGWHISYWGDGADRKVKLTWFTYTPSGRPLWLESDGLPFLPDRRWSGAVYKRSESGASEEFGWVTLQLTQDAKRIAVRWQRPDIGSYLPVAGLPASFVEECVFDIFRETQFPIDTDDSMSRDVTLSGVWQEVINPNRRTLHINRGTRTDAQTGELLGVELLFPLFYDSFNEPVWLYGQYGPTTGDIPAQIQYEVDHDNPDDGNLVYNFLNYGQHGSGPGPQHTCNVLSQCITRLGPASSNEPMKVWRSFDGLPQAQMKIGTTDHSGQIAFELPTNPVEYHGLRSWDRPASDSIVTIEKLNLYSTIQADRYECTAAPDQSSCPIQVSWSAQGNDNVSVWRTSLIGAPAVQLSVDAPGFYPDSADTFTKTHTGPKECPCSNASATALSTRTSWSNWSGGRSRAAGRLPWRSVSRRPS